MTSAALHVSAGRAAALLLILGLALAASGCGRKGPLEPPPDASAVQKPADDSMASFGHRKPTPVATPKTPFVLDPLL